MFEQVLRPFFCVQCRCVVTLIAALQDIVAVAAEHVTVVGSTLQCLLAGTAGQAGSPRAGAAAAACHQWPLQWLILCQHAGRPTGPQLEGTLQARHACGRPGAENPVRGVCWEFFG